MDDQKVEGTRLAQLTQFGLSCARIERISLDETQNTARQSPDNAGRMRLGKMLLPVPAVKKCPR